MLGEKSAFIHDFGKGIKYITQEQTSHPNLSVDNLDCPRSRFTSWINEDYELSVYKPLQEKMLQVCEIVNQNLL
jgi:hypothetical protein